MTGGVMYCNIWCCCKAMLLQNSVPVNKNTRLVQNSEFINHFFFNYW